ncbi:MAG TPA: Na+/H+ antiporter subunit G [Rhodobacteraceae bacterium]|nr:Na+/H+ antiporter subunit G [Paracoccaceae bacterium]
MTAFLDIIGGLALVGGAVFLLLGGLGLNRMPDSFGRIQVGAKTTTLGTALVLTGAGFLHPDMALKLFLIGVFLLFTNPLSSQVLARAAKRMHAPEAPETVVDKYSEDHAETSEDEA